MAIFKYLDLSTAHLSAETCKELDFIDGTTGPTVAKYDCGYFISVPESVEFIDDLGCDLPTDLRNVLRFARKIGCDVVRFDRDAEILSKHLPVFKEE